MLKIMKNNTYIIIYKMTKKIDLKKKEKDSG